MLDRVKAATGIDLQKTKDDIAAVLCEKTNAVNNIRDTFQKCVNEKLGVTEDTPEDGFEGKHHFHRRSWPPCTRKGNRAPRNN